ncbi:MAG: hypothetical protein IJM17_07800 [Firmicutes bacterium]|nr:hypothetical protein [Bacillota bacterium]
MLKVIGLGDNVVDQYLSLETIFPGGNTLNFAVYAAMQRADASYLGVFGDDRPAELIMNALRAHGVDFPRARQYPGENGRAQVTLVDGDRVFVRSNRGGALRHHPLVLDDEDLEYLNGFDLIHVSCFSFMDDSMKLLRPLKPFVSYDFSNRFTDEQLEKVCPNIDCAIVSLGSGGAEKAPALFEKIHGLGCPMVEASMGSEGALLSYKGKIYRQPAHLVEAVDTLGAGDAFLTTFLINFLDESLPGETEDEKIARSLDKAADFAASVCMTHGAFGMGERYTNTELEAVPR